MMLSNRTAILLLAATAFPHTVYGQAAFPLFRAVPGSAALSTSPQEFPGVKRSRVVTIDLALLDPRSLARVNSVSSASSKEMTLNLFDDATFKADLEPDASTAGGNTIVWTGKIDGAKFSEIILAATGPVVSANIMVDIGRSFRVRYLGGDQHVVQELEVRDFPPEAQPVPVGAVPDVPDRKVARNAARAGAIVLYTPEARQAAGGTAAIENEIRLWIAGTNLQCAAGALECLRLAYAGETNYLESGSILTDLERLQSPGDGYMDEVRALRRQHGAGPVTLWIHGAAIPCEDAHPIRPPAAAAGAFSVRLRTCRPR
jgi:hypothetical protein